VWFASEGRTAARSQCSFFSLEGSAVVEERSPRPSLLRALDSQAGTKCRSHYGQMQRLRVYERGRRAPSVVRASAPEATD